MKGIAKIFCCVFPFLILNTCKKNSPAAYALNAPAWFPAMKIPADNQLTEARIKLGRKLFYEPLLSSDSTVSCATCHLQDKAFSDGLQVSEGVANVLGTRNAPMLANIGYAPYFFHDGGVETLELQSQAPIFSPKEMNFTIAGFLERIANDQDYHQLFDDAYKRKPDAFGISRAIASFERTLISGNSRFDRYQYQGDNNALSEQELRGKDVFFSSETQCAECHQPPLFTNFLFENIGLYETYADSGRERITGEEMDEGKFKVPTIRNIALTAPYMHDGSLETLEEVVTHFSNGGVGHPNQSTLVVPLFLSEQQQEDLVAFLRTLTDQSFISDPSFSDPN